MPDVAPISYTTKIDANKTIHEIHELLARAGARRIATSYSDEGVADGISFALTTEAWGPRIFELPVNIDAMSAKLRTLKRNGRLGGLTVREAQSREQATRVAWRVVKTWLASQLSLLDTGMMSLEQVMFAHLKAGGFDSPTVYELAMSEPSLLAIESPGRNP